MSQVQVAAHKQLPPIYPNVGGRTQSQAGGPSGQEGIGEAPMLSVELAALEAVGLESHVHCVAVAGAWVEGRVDQSREGIVLSIGEAFAEDNVMVARITPEGDQFVVEFLLDEGYGGDAAEALRLVREELDFCFLELNHPEGGAWNYAIYLCGTMSNVYSGIHWSYYLLREDTSDA